MDGGLLSGELFGHAEAGIPMQWSRARSPHAQACDSAAERYRRLGEARL